MKAFSRGTAAPAASRELDGVCPMSPPPRRKRWPFPGRSFAAAALMALLAGGLHAAGQKEGRVPAVRVVTAGHAPASQLRDQLEPLLMLCRKQLNLPPEPSGMPSDAALARVASIETEVLLDGPRYAKYQTTRNLLPDDKDGCKVKVLRQFTVELESSCDRRWSATSGGPGFKAAPMKSSELVYTQDAEQARSSPCQVRVEPTPDLVAAWKKTSRQPAGLGAQCLWSNELGLHLGGSKASAHPDPLSGSCYAANLPDYPFTTYQGNRRSVSLKFRMARLPGDTFRPPGIVAGLLDQELKEFSMDAAIPEGRFSRAQAEAFLKQPAIVPLAEPSK